jgi:hypothetical protein
VLATGFLLMVGLEAIGVVVLPSIAATSPGYVTDVLAVAVPGGAGATGDIGLLQQLIDLGGATYLIGGVLFGIALLRAGVLARWASALLVVGGVAPLGILLLPQVNFRLFAIPTGVALVGLGYSLWREQRTAAARPGPDPVNAQLEPVDAT